MAQTPMVIMVSGIVGQYVWTSSKGFGTNPPMIRPKPLSIQSEMNSMTQARASVPSFFRMDGQPEHQTSETTAKTLDVHIMGTSSLWPSSPA